MSSKRYWLISLLIAACSLWIRSGFALTAMPVYKHDDELFVRLAHYLAAGQWLGPYDNLTLAKGTFYPMFIAASFWASVPLKIAEHLLYLPGVRQVRTFMVLKEVLSTTALPV